MNEYKSPLLITTNLPSVVIYKDSQTGETVGKVYSKGGTWFLSTLYINHWYPVEVLSKYGGFLFLNSLHKERKIYR